MSAGRSAIAAMALLVPLAGCLDGSGNCGNEFLSRLDAPGGGKSAVMFERSCGATTGFSTQISIMRPGETPREADNAFVADYDSGAAGTDDPSISWPSISWVEMQWLGPDRLQVRYPPRSRILLRREAISGVRIVYREANEY